MRVSSLQKGKLFSNESSNHRNKLACNKEDTDHRGKRSHALPGDVLTV